MAAVVASVAMTRSLAAWAAVVFLAACGGSAPVRTTVGNVGAAGTLADALRADLGRGVPVAIVPGKDGLVALSADGARRRVLVTGPVPWALVDDRLGVVWFGSADRTSILMLDLRGANADPLAPEVIASGLPESVEPGGPEYGIAYGSPPTAEEGMPLPMFAELEYSRSILPSVVLLVGPAPRLATMGGILDMWGETAGFDAAIAKASLPGRDRVIEVAARGAAPRAPAEPVVVPDKVAGVDPGNCEDDSCGTAQVVPGTKLWRVVTSFTCGDGCYTEWALYDPARRAFVEGEWAGWLGQAQVAADGSAFVRDGMVVRFDRGPVNTNDPEFEASGGGWLDGGPWLTR